MKKGFVTLVAGVLSATVFSKSVFAEFDKQCNISFQSYISPSIAGCVFSADKSGKLSFKLSGSQVTPARCLAGAGMDESQVNQLMEMIKGDDFAGEKGLLLVRDEGRTLSGKLISNKYSGDGLSFPSIKKDFGGTAVATLDSGLTIRLKVQASANLKLSGDFGAIRFSGPCFKYDGLPTSSLSSKSPSSSKIDKAKSTCKELGFTAGTEKHGECVLKMMDN